MVAYGNERNYRVREVCKVNGETRWPIVEKETQETDSGRVDTLADAFFGAAMVWGCAFASSKELDDGKITAEDESLKNLYESVHTTGHGTMHLKWSAQDAVTGEVLDVEADYSIDVID